MKKHKYGWSNKASLYCDDSLWSKFKKIVPDNMSITDFIVYLISREVDDVKNGRKYDVNGLITLESKYD